MRILHWNDGYYPRIGGTERLVRDLCHAQMAAGHTVTVVGRALPGSPNEELLDGIQVWRRPVADEEVPGRPDLLKRQVVACGEYKRRFQPDLIHIHGSHMAGWLHLLSRDSATCPAIMTLHAPVRLPQQVLRRVLNHVDALTAVSESVREDLAPLWQGRAGGVQVIHNGLSPPPNRPAPPPPGPLRVVCLGRMVRAKGFDVALRALASLPDLHLTLAGDGVELPPLKQLAHELGIAHRVDFRGWVHPESVSALINEAGLVVVPSRWREPFGLVAVQAAQMGRPVVASNVGGLPEVVRHGVTGLLVAPDAPKELSDAIAWMSGHPEEAAALGAAAQKLAATHFSIDRCAGEYAALYAKVKTEVPP